MEDVQWTLFSARGTEALMSRGVHDIVGRRRRKRARVAQTVLVRDE